MSDYLDELMANKRAIDLMAKRAATHCRRNIASLCFRLSREISEEIERACGISVESAPDYAAGVEQMLLNEQCGGDGWWAGWDMVKAAHFKAIGVKP